MQQRQAWMREYLAEIGTLKNSFIASAHSQDDPVVVAKAMRNILGITSDWANAQSTWEDALRHLREKIEQAGILISLMELLEIILIGNWTLMSLEAFP